ncbi:hypothetical protein IAI53_10215 [Thauera sp. CAU 1555]|jgi:hypothetical protein|uniref:Uncharacterized protein n=1 Tax=Thauera sedimentorum TaxID=2767595 RepID=A0ABR9BBC8_9RHOO|nr:hypothetical protein [Thauera sedimentorum]MBC9072335.1 hypothetical protein [Thauera sedimentorum]MBD8503254.1 hypothetical protein [Thauera sedimentorum]
MEPQARRIIEILESEVLAICDDEGVECGDFDALLERLEGHEATTRHLSAPVVEALRSLLSLRRDLLAIHIRGRR